MALNSLGQISMGGSTAGQSIALELGLPANAEISLGTPAVYALGGFGSASNIDMGTFRGKSNRTVIADLSSVMFTTNRTQTTINIGTLSGYRAGKTDVTITIASGVYIYSTSTGVPALTVQGGAFGDTITIVNNGYIMGMGGAGGYSTSAGGAGGGGGPAMSLFNNIAITNNGYIGGGGGGGLGASDGGGGGGAGGGVGGSQSAFGTVSYGGVGGQPGSSGGNGTGYRYGGGGGGRIMPGVGGTGGYQGQGGGGGAGGGGVGFNARGGNGGSGGAAGGAATARSYGGWGYSGGGGGWGASGGTGGAGGKAINKNGYTVTTSGTGTIYGGVS